MGSQEFRSVIRGEGKQVLAQRPGRCREKIETYIPGLKKQIVPTRQVQRAHGPIGEKARLGPTHVANRRQRVARVRTNARETPLDLPFRPLQQLHECIAVAEQKACDSVATVISVRCNENILHGISQRHGDRHAGRADVKQAENWRLIQDGKSPTFDPSRTLPSNLRMLPRKRLRCRQVSSSTDGLNFHFSPALAPDPPIGTVSSTTSRLSPEHLVQRQRRQ